MGYIFLLDFRLLEGNAHLVPIPALASEETCCLSFHWRRVRRRVRANKRHEGKMGGRHQTTFTWQFFVTFLGWLSDPYKWFSDLQLGDEKVTLNHLAANPMLPVIHLRI